MDFYGSLLSQRRSTDACCERLFSDSLLLKGCPFFTVSQTTNREASMRRIVVQSAFNYPAVSGVSTLIEERSSGLRELYPLLSRVISEALH